MRRLTNISADFWRLAITIPTTFAVVAGVLAFGVPPVSAAQGTGGPQVIGTTWSALKAAATTDKRVPVIVELAAPASDPSAKRRARAALRKAIAKTGAEHVKDIADLPAMSLQVDVQALEALRLSGAVRNVRIDREYALDDESSPGPSRPAKARAPLPQVTSDVPATTAQGTSSNGTFSALPQWWDYSRIGVPSARSLGWTGTGQTVAVIDTGVDRNHPWIGGHVVAEGCFANPAVGVTGGICPNGTTTQYGAGAAAPCTYTAPTGSCGHGTHTAQSAAGSHAGVASGARIIAVQVFHAKWDGVKWLATYYESDLTRALSYVYSLRTTYRIAAVNMSLGGGMFAGFCDNIPMDNSAPATYVTGWVNALRSVGIASVVSSGNANSSTKMSSPACISNAISVGNSTLDANGNDAVFGGVSIGSNSNSTLDLLAPGTDICSALPGNRSACDWIGTSMAAPHVAGAIAVLRQRRPTATVGQILLALQRSGTAVYDSRNGVTRTRINVYKALSWI